MARDADTTDGLLGRWLRESKSLGTDRFVGKGHKTELEEEVRKLRRENARLQEERTISKKAARFMLLEKPSFSSFYRTIMSIKLV